MTNEERKALQIAACKVRMGVIESTHGAKAGHPGGSLSAAEMFAYLYNKEMRIDPADPKWDDRDRFVLSKGHTAPGLYSALAYRGFFPVADLPTLRHIDSYLQGHPNMNTVPGVDMSTGSLGQGVSCAAGMAKAAKYLKKDNVRVYTLLGDGEIEEGEVWEAFMFAAKYALDNFCRHHRPQRPADRRPHKGRHEHRTGRRQECATSALRSSQSTATMWTRSRRRSTSSTRRPASPPPSSCTPPRARASALWKTRSAGHGKAPNDEEYKTAMDELNAQMAELEAQA